MLANYHNLEAASGLLNHWNTTEDTSEPEIVKDWQARKAYVYDANQEDWIETLLSDNSTLSEPEEYGSPS